MNRLLLQLLIALLAIINYSISENFTSTPNDFVDDISASDDIQEFSEAPQQQEVNPDFVLIDDMILSPLQYDVIYTEPSKRNGYSPVVRPWLNAVIPYMIDDDYSAAEKSIMRTAMSVIERETCVRFRRLYYGHNETDYVYIQHGHGCASTVGFWGGMQTVFLHKKGCMDVGRILHTFLHLLGMFHMHTAIDRDEYVEIEWENIILTAIQNFVTFESDVSMFGTKYDYDSVTHYPPKAFSKDGKLTIISKRPEGVQMGQRDHLSVGDIMRINRMYNCA